MKTTFSHLTSDSTMKEVLRNLFVLQMQLELMQTLSDEPQSDLKEIIHSIDHLFESILATK